MGKKVKEYKSGDFIFAKVKGYPAWPARVQKPNGKKYFVYFYGTGETANLPPNMIFDYAENKDKFLTKTVKRRDFNDGVKQIEYDFANNVPLEEVIGVPVVEGAEAPANDTADDSAIDATMDDSGADTTANDTVTDDANATQNDATVEDSDDAGALVIDEGKTPAKGKKVKADVKGKETPKPKEPKTPRGKGKKEEPKEKDKEEEKIDEELVSRSGRKIRPKRYIDEQTEDNATLPSPAAKKRRGASPAAEKEKADVAKDKDSGKNEKSVAQFNVVKQTELESLKEVFKPVDEDKENILIAYLPSGAYAGIRLFQARPRSFKNEAARLQWDKQAARNALTLKIQLEREHITPQSVQGQLVMDLNLTDEEKTALDKERETEEKKSRVNFLKTEMKLIELDAKIKTCLCLEKADTELCLKLLDELLTLEVKPLMLLKHPTCLETVKRMRAYVGNTPSWDLSESEALTFNKQAHMIRKKADTLYKNMKEHFQTPDGLSFWEYFSERVLIFKKVTATLNAGELLELVHEPLELSQPNATTMRAAIDEANNSVPPLPDSPDIDEEEKQLKKKTPAGKSKKPAPTSTPSKSKRTRGKKEEETSDQTDAQKPEEDTAEKVAAENGPESGEKEKVAEDAVEEEASKGTPPEQETAKNANEDVEMAELQKVLENDESTTETDKNMEASPEESETSEKTKPNNTDKTTKDTDKPMEKSSKKDKKAKEDKSDTSENSKDDESEKSEKKDAEKRERKNSKEEKNSKDGAKNGKEGGKEKEDKSDMKDEKSDDKPESGEPRAKRSRETKKSEPPPPRSPAKRKSKF